MWSGIVGGVLGLIRVIISLRNSFKLNEQNQKFQKGKAKKDREYRGKEKSITY